MVINLYHIYRRNTEHLTCSFSPNLKLCCLSIKFYKYQNMEILNMMASQINYLIDVIIIFIFTIVFKLDNKESLDRKYYVWVGSNLVRIVPGSEVLCVCSTNKKKDYAMTPPLTMISVSWAFLSHTENRFFRSNYFLNI